jgi:hypothetical protein
LAQCIGRQVVEVALASVDEAAVERPDRLAELWEEACLPVQAFWLADATDLSVWDDAIELEGDGLVCSAIKPADQRSEGIVVRCYNARPKPVEGRWRFGRPRARAWRVRADERGGSAADLAEGGHVLPFRAEPLAWVTHLVS